MDSETKQFVDKCLRSAGESIRNMTSEERNRQERELAVIRLQGSIALEALENCQRQEYYRRKHDRYAGVLD